MANTVTDSRSAYLTSSRYKNGRGDRDRWSGIWFKALCRFTEVPCLNEWNFSAEQVIAYLRYRLSIKDPAWNRLRIVQGLMLHREKHPVVGAEDLKFIEVKLKQVAASERVVNNCQKVARDWSPHEPAANGKADLNRRGGSDTFDDAKACAGSRSGEREEILIDVVGKIDSREPEVVQKMRRRLRLMGREWNTEKAYIKWVKRFLISRGVSTFEQCLAVNNSDVEAFLTDLVVDGNVAASTQDQAFYALLFLFEHVLDRNISNIEAMRSAKPKLQPTVMSQNEVAKVLGELRGRYLLVAQLLYGCGIRISEALRLRVKDIDFDHRQIVIYCSKGKKSRLVPLPEKTVVSLHLLIEDRRRLHAIDEAKGIASVWLPFALDRKFVNAHREFKWQFLFASERQSKDSKTGRLHRHHIHRTSFSKALRRAVDRANILKYVTAHTFRHSFATVLLMTGTDIRVVQELLGHADVSTTMIYTHVLFDHKSPVVSPLDLAAD